MSSSCRSSPGRQLTGLSDLFDRMRWAEAPIVVAALVWTALAYVLAHARHFAVVYDPNFPQWWDWTDQGRYYRAAQAWATGVLDPAQHWYFAGYPLLGALFFRINPGQPFYFVDLSCLVLLGAALALLSARLATGLPWARALGAAVFLLTVATTPYGIKSFIEPWTTTPTAPLSLAALLLAFRLWDRPSPNRAAVLGLVTGSIVLFRPTDLLPLGLAVAACSAVALRRLSLRTLTRVALAGAAGLAIPAAMTAASYLAVFGWHRNAYLAQSAQTGFEWRLIPLHWVTLFVSAQPEYPNEYSLSQTFPWIVPGVAGMAACLVASSGVARLRHALVIAAVAVHCLLYLSYRDLHLQGLFRYGTYHYFKWCLPVLGLYAGFLVVEVVRHRRRVVAWAVGVAVALGLFSWRMEWREVSAPWLAGAWIEPPRTLELPQSPHSVYDGLFVPAAGAPSQIYLADHKMQLAGTEFDANADFKAFPSDGGLIFTVLRPMPDGPAVIRFEEGVALLPGPLHLKHARLFLRWPHVLQVATTYAWRWWGAK